MFLNIEKDETLLLQGYTFALMMFSMFFDVIFFFKDLY